MAAQEEISLDKENKKKVKCKWCSLQWGKEKIYLSQGDDGVPSPEMINAFSQTIFFVLAGLN